LALPIEIVSGATCRAQDGLALSSRNSYLDADARAEAVQLSRTLQGMIAALKVGEHNIVAIEQHAMRTLAERGWQPDYMSVRRRADLQPPQAADLIHPETLVVLGAARLGTTRLIDNIEV
ncbi:MAG: pantoate--beta-alanine ligase, partial [Hylemonella sp.]|nr:pantoate--beta-alanine ligase [Hylemonella sp.]